MSSQVRVAMVNSVRCFYHCATEYRLPALSKILFLPDALRDRHIYKDSKSKQVVGPLVLPSGLIIPCAELPPQFTQDFYECGRMDVKIRRRKVTKHQLVKRAKSDASRLKVAKLMQDSKTEKQLQAQFTYWTDIAKGRSTLRVAKEKLSMAHRSGYYVNILGTRGGLD